MAAVDARGSVRGMEGYAPDDDDGGADEAELGRICVFREG